MNRKSVPQSQLQQQPLRLVNRQQQQSSGSGEFQPSRSHPMARPFEPSSNAKEHSHEQR